MSWHRDCESGVAMETLLRRHLWSIELPIIGLCAVFLARAASSAIELTYLESVPSPRPAEWVRNPVGRPAYSKDVEAIVARNMFCATCLPHTETSLSPADQLRKTSLPLALVAVMYPRRPSGVDWPAA